MPDSKDPPRDSTEPQRDDVPKYEPPPAREDGTTEFKGSESGFGRIVVEYPEATDKGKP